MAEWNHRMCGECWVEREGKWTDNHVKSLQEDHPVPDDEARVMLSFIRRPMMGAETPEGTCCFCGGKTRLGIFIRHDPKTLSCKHEETNG